MFKTPIVLVIFNRPAFSHAIFNIIRKIRPTTLLVIADGPRTENDRQLCEEARNIIHTIDWECELYTKLSDRNLGGPICVSEGLDWVFTRVEEAIIIEDDCIPDITFFSFCRDLLEYYRFDDRVMHITGNNFLGGRTFTDDSYFFSRYASSWGWATWRRAWTRFDLDLTTWPEAKKKKLLQEIYNNDDELRYWSKIFEKVYLKESVHWDYAWHYACLYYGGLAATPKYNLVSNIGFGRHATHTKNPNREFAFLPTVALRNLKHPRAVSVDKTADSATFYTRYAIDQPLRIKPSLRIRRLFRESDSYRLLRQSCLRTHYVTLQSFMLFLEKLLWRIKHWLRPTSRPYGSGSHVFLHLGCGSVNKPGFINIDGMPHKHLHYLMPIDKLKRFPDDSVDLIYASHCLEHFSHKRIVSILKEWRRTLKEGGVLRLSVPDFDVLFRIYKEGGNKICLIQEMLMGGHESQYDYHMTTFNRRYLSELLATAGFHVVRQWLPGSAEDKTFNDWSGRPVVKNGKVYYISLNIEAVK